MSSKKSALGVQRKYSYIRDLFFVFLVFVTVCILSIMLPHDKSIRYYQIGEDGRKARWIYDRIRHDFKNLDVVFLGSSRTMMGVDAERIDSLLSKNIDCQLTSVNFGMPYTGDNITFVIAKKLVEARSVSLLVIEVRETQARMPNPMFRYLADTKDVLMPVWLLNPNALSDIAFLPRRQASLFLQTWLPDIGSPPTGYNAKDYYGSYWFKEAKNGSHTLSEMKYLKQKSLNEKRGNILPKTFDLLEFNLARQYISRTAVLAREKGVQVVFLYLPSFDAPVSPIHEKFLREIGTIWSPPREILDEPTNWDDLSHLNRKGAVLLSDWLAGKIAGAKKDYIFQFL